MSAFIPSCRLRSLFSDLGARRSVGIGISIPTRQSATAPMPNTKSTSAPSSPQQSSAIFAQINPFSPNSAGAETLHLSSAWPTRSSRAALLKLLASTPFRISTTPNLTGTSVPISAELKKNAVVSAGTSTLGHKILRKPPRLCPRPNQPAATLYQLQAATVALHPLSESV